MKIDLFSDAHLEVARELFPEYIDDPRWLNTQWTDEEINACKAFEAKEFTERSTLQTYPWKPIEPTSNEVEEHTVYWVNQYLCSNSKVNNILSIGCGGGDGVVAGGTTP